jgi:hypothetical protein
VVGDVTWPLAPDPPCEQMLAAVGFGCWGVVSQCCSSHHHQTSTIHPTSRCSWRWRGVVPVPARLVPPFAISSPVPPPASSFHPLSTPQAVARGARGGWCSLSRSPLLLLLIVVLFPHRPPIPPPASSFHPLSTPRAVACEARGGWCSPSHSPLLLLLLLILFPPRCRRLVPPLRRCFVVSLFHPPTPPRRRSFVSPPLVVVSFSSLLVISSPLPRLPPAVSLPRAVSSFLPPSSSQYIQYYVSTNARWLTNSIHPEPLLADQPLSRPAWLCNPTALNARCGALLWCLL